jgi:hypothetical protein
VVPVSSSTGSRAPLEILHFTFFAGFRFELHMSCQLIHVPFSSGIQLFTPAETNHNDGNLMLTKGVDIEMRTMIPRASR